MPQVDWNQEEVADPQERSFEVLPKGKYPCIINSSVEKETKAKTGSFFEFEFEVVKGDFKGRKVWARFNVHNPSEVAQRIGREQLKGLCNAAGKPGARTTELLHGKYVVCLVSVERGQNGDMNRVDGFESVEKFRASGTEPPERKAAVMAGVGDDDDIPF